MFQLRYAAAELRRRLGRTIVTALGLAVGVGLVTGIIGVSQGLSDAQGKVLSPLQDVGTDILVTRVVGATNATGSGSTTTTTQANAPGPQDGFGGGGFFGGGNDRNNRLNASDAQEVLNENSSVITDLSKLGKPGDKFTHDFFLSATLLSFPDDAVSQIAGMNGVQSAVGGLTQLASHQTGTVPNQVATIQTGGQEFDTTVTAPRMTDADREKIRQCIANATSADGATTTPPASGQQQSQGGNGGGRRSIDPSIAAKCFPDGQQFRTRVTTPLQTLQQAINPPQTDTTTTSYTAAGVDPAHPDQGLVTKSQLTEGAWLDPNSPTDVLISTAYANKNNLKVGGTLPINGVDYKIVGLVNPSLSGNTADVYFSLAKIQELASKQARVTSVLVKAKSAADVDGVVAQIKTALPGAQVVTTKDLSDQVTGSLADAKKLTDRLGGALGAIVLIAAFIIAVLLTLSSISKRVREIGTLRAIGWSKMRVVRQILTETLGIGVLGGILGILIGIGAVSAVSEFSPKFTATVNNAAGLSGSSLSTVFGQSASTATTTTVALDAPIHIATIGIAFGFALLGGLLAGAIGGWRAARLSPATALRNVG
jgi:ABC-type antimicrobial peptide transport system permease subunit